LKLSLIKSNPTQTHKKLKFYDPAQPNATHTCTNPRPGL